MLPAPFADALILTGPTGSGKTQLAIDLAQRLDAEIISMDSMAVYRHLDIGTAKPSLRQRQMVRHHLIDVLEPWESASVAWWLREAAACCRDITGRGKQVLVVGGTPLYLKALLFGLFDGPPADAHLRRRLLEEATRLGSMALHEHLAQVDAPTAARIHPNDTRRIIRALEVFELTGQPISAWQRQWSQESEVRSQESGVRTRSEARNQESGIRAQEPEVGQVPPASCLLTPDSCRLPPDSCILWLDLPRSVLYDRINRRVVEMFAGGLTEEVRALRELDKPLSGEARQALGYKEVLAYLNGQASLEETIARVQTRTRNFAKRQITWFRHLPGCRSATERLTETLWQPRMN